jgi:hypothetical protein
LADAIICVHSRKYKAFFTVNFKDSRVLCKEMRQLLIELHQDLDGPVEYQDYRDSQEFVGVKEAEATFSASALEAEQ